MLLPNQVKPILRNASDPVRLGKASDVNPQRLTSTTILSRAVFFPGFLPELGFSSLVYCLPGPGPGGLQCVFLG